MTKVMEKQITNYVGIDFSKAKFDACLFKEQGIMEHSQFPNTKAGYLQLMKWVKITSQQGASFDASLVLFCGENTGTCSMGLCDYLYSKGIKVWLETPLKIKYGSGLNRVKSDKADAQMIALYAKRFYQPETCPLFKPESHDLKLLRSLYLFRNRLVRDRVAMSNRIASGAFDFSALVKNRMKKQFNEAKKDQICIEKEMIQLMETSQEFASNYQILLSFKGIGPVTAAALIVYTANFERFDNPRKFACYSGIAPFGKQSGTSIHTKPHVSRFAHIEIKTALVQAAKSAMRFNPAIKEYAQRLYNKGKHEGVVMNNVKNKLVHILFKMIQTQTYWDQDYQKAHNNDGKSRIEQNNIGAMASQVTPIIEPLVQTLPNINDTPLKRAVRLKKKIEKNRDFTCVET